MTTLPIELWSSIVQQLDTQSLFKIKQSGLQYYRVARDELFRRKDPAAIAYQRKLLEDALTHPEAVLLSAGQLSKFTQNPATTGFDCIKVLRLMANNAGIKLVVNDAQLAELKKIGDTDYLSRQNAWLLLQGIIDILAPAQVEEIVMSIVSGLKKGDSLILKIVLPALNLLIPKIQPAHYPTIFPMLVQLIKSKDFEVRESNIVCIKTLYHVLNANKPNFRYRRIKQQVKKLLGNDTVPPSKIFLYYGGRLSPDDIELIYKEVFSALTTSPHFFGGLSTFVAAMPYFSKSKRLSLMTIIKDEFVSSYPQKQSEFLKVLSAYADQLTNDEVGELFSVGLTMLDHSTSQSVKALIEYFPSFMQNRAFALYKGLSQLADIAFRDPQEGLVTILQEVKSHFTSEMNQQSAALKLFLALVPKLNHSQAKKIFACFVRDFSSYYGNYKLAINLIVKLTPLLAEDEKKAAVSLFINLMYERYVPEGIYSQSVRALSDLQKSLSPAQVDQVLLFMITKFNSQDLFQKSYLKALTKFSAALKPEHVEVLYNIAKHALKEAAYFNDEFVAIELLRVIADQLSPQQVTNILLEVVAQLNHDVFWKTEASALHLISQLILLGKCTKKDLEALNIQGMKHGALIQSILAFDAQLQDQQYVVTAKKSLQERYLFLKEDSVVPQNKERHEFNAHQTNTQQQGFFAELNNHKRRSSPDDGNHCVKAKYSRQV